jgi:hypothetical protein
VAAFQLHVMRKNQIVFLVHSPNPATGLKLAQIGYIRAGKITDGKQVGGTDQTMIGGTPAMVKKVVMDGTVNASSVKSPTSVVRIAELILDWDSGSSGLGKGFAKNRWQVEDCGNP